MYQTDVMLPFDLTRYTKEIVMMWVPFEFHPWSQDILEAGIPLGKD